MSGKSVANIFMARLIKNEQTKRYETNNLLEFFKKFFDTALLHIEDELSLFSCAFYILGKWL